MSRSDRRQSNSRVASHGAAVILTALISGGAGICGGTAAPITVSASRAGIDIQSDGRSFCRIASVAAGLQGQKPRSLRIRQARTFGSRSSQVNYAGDACDVRLSVIPRAGEPYARVRVAAINPTSQARAVDVRITLTRLAPSAASSALAFSVENKFGVNPLRRSLADGPMSARYGVRNFAPGTGDTSLYLPVLAFGRRPSLVLMCDQRTAFQFDVGASEATISRRFFLPGKVGAADEKINLGADLGTAYHEFCIGTADDPSWDDLVWDFLATAYPGAWTEPAVDAGPFMTAGLSNFRFSDRWLARIYSYGGRLIGLASAGTKDEYARQKNLLDVPLVHGGGLRATTGIDRYTRDLEQEKGYGLDNAAEPDLLWQNVRDALVLTPDGKPQPVWSGMAVNMSPEFSYGKALLRIVKEKVEKHAFDGVFIDYYLDGDAADGTRPYGQYPFYPTVASDARFLADLSDWLHKRGKILILNCVAPGAGPLLRYADAHACDCKPELFFQWKLLTGPMPLASYGGSTFPREAFTSRGWLESGFSALFYGATVPAWAFQPEGADALVNNVHFLLDPEIGQPLFARNAWFGDALAEALPVGGDAENMTSLFFRSSHGLFLAYRNLGRARESLRANFGHRRLGMDRSADYTLFRWDPDRGATLLLRKVRGDNLLRPFAFDLEPGQTSFVCAVPYQRASVLGYAAFADDGLPYVSSATDRVTSLRVGGDGSVSFTMNGMPSVLGEMQIALPVGWQPGKIAVQGAEDYTARVLDKRVVVSARLAGPLTVTLSPSVRGGDKLSSGAVLTGRPEREELPVPEWRSESGDWAISERRLELRARTAGASVVRAADAVPSSYVLEFDVTRTTTDPTPQPHVEVILGKTNEGDISVDWNSRFSLMAAHTRELAPGIDTAMHPNQYTKHIRSYRLRIEKDGARVRVFLSYNGGDSYEDVADFELPPGIADGLGFALTNTEGRFESIRLTGR